MVQSVNPNYYAAGVEFTTYELTGSGFLSIPQGAVGILALDNDEPMHHRNSMVPGQLFNINVVSDSLAYAVCSVSLARSVATYLGGIVTENRQVDVWVNNTKPLP